MSIPIRYVWHNMFLAITKISFFEISARRRPTLVPFRKSWGLTMVLLWYDLHEKLHPEDGVWRYINDIFSDSMINMLQESEIHVISPKQVLE